MQTKLIILLSTILAFFVFVGGAFYLGHNRGYNSGVSDTDAKYTKEALDATKAADDKANKQNESIAVVAKDLEVKKTKQQTFKGVTDANYKNETTKVPVYSECVVPASGVLLNTTTATTLNQIRSSGKSSDQVPGTETSGTIE